ncbi:hypothetical protein HELRODRAFT_189956 [Helobdella robusta]|uniref:Uncharacterized protein n=1 Tax=Helobdella robusta TaxID=6412 RepID=T1FRJ0_HELRO|nr:hypothetical protein HELRODRAFT_189956 [Helobdella robusta]ESN90702.1 hypothetical protein HELRODRAFT_189956 [Helobdella robusta]
MNVDQNKCFLKLKIVYSVLGILTGISVAVVFGVQYANYHVSAWGLVTSFYALQVLILHSLYASNKWINGGKKLKVFTGIGIFGQILNLLAILAYLVIAISEEQKLTPYGPRGFFMASIWVAITWKWAFLTTLYSIKYRRLLINSLNPNSLVPNPDSNPEQSTLFEPTESDPLVPGSSNSQRYMV